MVRMHNFWWLIHVDVFVSVVIKAVRALAKHERKFMFQNWCVLLQLLLLLQFVRLKVSISYSRMTIILCLQCCFGFL